MSLVLKKIFKTSYIFLFISVIVIGITIRYNYLENHFIGGVDDLGVAKTIIDFDDSLSTFKKNIILKKVHLLEKYKNITNGLHIQNAEKLRVYDYILNIRLWWQHQHAISYNWTYAPLQFYLTERLLNSKMNLKEIKFWGRFPSFIASISTLFLFILYFVKFSGKLQIEKKAALLISITLLSLSCQNIVYAAQMHSFAIGVLSVIILIYFLSIITNNPSLLSNKKAYALGLLLGILTMSQYQLLFFLPGFLLALFFWYYKVSTSKELIYFLIFVLLGFITLSIPFVFTFLINLTENGVNWNRGPNNIYLLKFNSNYICDNIIYLTTFLIKNGSNVICSMLSPIGTYNIVNTIFKIVSTILIFIGFISLLNGNQFRFSLFIFILTTTIVWIILLLFKKITLSPSRHSMVLVPFFLILFVIGFNTAINLINSLLILESSMLLSLLIIFSFSYFLKDEIKNRLDNLDENKITKIVKNDSSAILLSYETNFSINFIKNFPNTFTIIEINSPWGINKNYYITNKLFFKKRKQIYFSAFSTTREINSSDIAKFNSLFKVETGFKPKRIVLVRKNEITNNTYPDWAFPKIKLYNYNSYYYYLFHLYF